MMDNCKDNVDRTSGLAKKKDPSPNSMSRKY